jgi:hypothetical protein
VCPALRVNPFVSVKPSSKARPAWIGRRQNPNTCDGIERFIRLYEAWGKPDKLAEWKQKLATLGEAEAKKKRPGRPLAPLRINTVWVTGR